MIAVIRSTSEVISCRNSTYISFGTSSCSKIDSLSTFTELKGVFSSCDTLETNCWRLDSTFSSWSAIWLQEIARSTISLCTIPLTFARCSKCPSDILRITSIRFFTGSVKTFEIITITISTKRTSVPNSRYASLPISPRISCTSDKLSTISTTPTRVSPAPTIEAAA